MLDIMETLEEWIEPFRQFIIDNQSNPVLWIGIIIIGLGVFAFTYSALSKNG